MAGDGQFDGICNILGVVDLSGSGKVVLGVGFNFKSVSCDLIINSDTNLIISDCSFGSDGERNLGVLEGCSLWCLDGYEGECGIIDIPCACLSWDVVVEEALQHTID